MIALETSKLLEEMSEDPRTFYERGGAYKLLQRSFRERDISFLLSILESEDLDVVRTGVFCASELGIRAAPLVDAVIPLAVSDDLKIAYQAIEVIAVCSIGDRAPFYATVLAALEESRIELRALAMELAVFSDEEQFRAANSSGRLNAAHSEGVNMLCRSFGHVEISNLLASSSALDRRYGTVALLRLARAGKPVGELRSKLYDEDAQRLLALRRIRVLLDR